MPDPKADQLVPFQRAILMAETPPAVSKFPPTYKLLFSSKPIDRISLFVPDTLVALSTRALHALFSHLVILFTVIPPATENTPPTNNAPVSLSLIFNIGPLVPSTKEDQDVPFHFAMLFAVTPPIVVKSPAT